MWVRHSDAWHPVVLGTIAAFSLLFLWLHCGAFGILIPKAGIEPMAPSSGLLTTGPPGHSYLTSTFHISHTLTQDQAGKGTLRNVVVAWLNWLSKAIMHCENRFAHVVRLFSKHPSKAGPPVCRWGNQIFRSDNFSSRRFFAFINLFLAVLGLCCCVWASPSCRELRLLSLGVPGLTHCGGFSCCSGAWALECTHAGPRVLAQQVWHTDLVPRRTWNLPRPEIEPVSSALVGGFLTTGPPGKSKIFFFFFNMGHFKTLYCTCYNIVSVLCFGFLATRHAES